MKNPVIARKIKELTTGQITQSEYNQWLHERTSHIWYDDDTFKNGGESVYALNRVLHPAPPINKLEAIIK